MDGALLLSMVSVVVATSAVLVAIWQVRENAKNVEKSNSLPILTDASSGWRSAELRSHKARIMQGLEGGVSVTGFEALPNDIRESAYAWCYFCDYLGLLAAHEIVPEELIITISGTQLVQMWHTLEPFIREERRLRRKTLPDDVPAGFVPYYEHIVARIQELGGRQATAGIQKRRSIRRLQPPVPVRRAVVEPRTP